MLDQSDDESTPPIQPDASTSARDRQEVQKNGAKLIKDESPDESMGYGSGSAEDKELEIPDDELTGRESMKEVRSIVKAHKLLNHIKTGGKGRTKALIVEEINRTIRMYRLEENHSDLDYSTERSRSPSIYETPSPRSSPQRPLENPSPSLVDPPFHVLPPPLPPIPKPKPPSRPLHPSGRISNDSDHFARPQSQDVSSRPTVRRSKLLDVVGGVFLIPLLIVITYLMMNPFRTVPYCDSDGGSPFGGECKMCPEFALCKFGEAVCQGGRVMIDGECQFDQTEINYLVSQLDSHVQSVLSWKRAKQECRSNYIYRTAEEFWGATDDGSDGSEGKYMTMKELRTSFEEALGLDSRSPLLQKAYDAWKKSFRIKPWLAFTRGKGFYARKASKPWVCFLCFLITEYWWLMSTVAVISVVITWVWWKRRSNLVKVGRIMKRVEQGLKNAIEVLRMQTDVHSHYGGWVPVTTIRKGVNQRMVGTLTNKEWKRVMKKAGKSHVVTSGVQMFDGTQKTAWKLSMHAPYNPNGIMI